MEIIKILVSCKVTYIYIYIWVYTPTCRHLKNNRNLKCYDEVFIDSMCILLFIYNPIMFLNNKVSHLKPKKIIAFVWKIFALRINLLSQYHATAKLYHKYILSQFCLALMRPQIYLILLYNNLINKVIQKIWCKIFVFRYATNDVIYLKK